jgi:hypothetical protein
LSLFHITKPLSWKMHNKHQLLLVWRGVIDMNRKALVITAALLAIAMLLTPVMAKTYGKGLTVDTYTVTMSDPSTLTNMVEEPGTPKLVCDGTIRIGHGAYRELDYNGPLGTGKLYMLTLQSKTYLTTPYNTNAGTGGGVYQYTLVIDSGSYGSGTLKGIAKLEWDYDATGIPLFYQQWDTARLVPVEGDLNIKWVSIEGYNLLQIPPSPPLTGWWWTSTTVVS